LKRKIWSLDYRYRGKVEGLPPFRVVVEMGVEKISRERFERS